MSERATSIPESELRELRERGIATERGWGPFVDPAAITESKDILRNRGERWAAAVLGRSLERRAILNQAWPWLYPGEVAALILIDGAERDAEFRALTAGM